jgi:hypothetical protein
MPLNDIAAVVEALRGRPESRMTALPGPATRPGVNELIILELHAASVAVAFHPAPDLGHTDL